MKVALIGYGKMGKEIEQVINAQQAGDEVLLRISENNLDELSTENLRKCDVAIEFTQPESAVNNIYKCFEAGIPVVVGTTAWLHELNAVKEKCREMNGALFFSPNFSIGVNLFWEANKILARLMNNQPQYKASMVEIHHTEKKDAPSGTAVKTADIIIDELERLNSWKLTTGSQPLPDELPIVALREPHVPGTHTVTYTSEVDFLEVKHEAKSRKGFAEGAVLAARFMVGKKGVFEMKDLLRL